jgi:hypothetical protein
LSNSHPLQVLALSLVMGPMVIALPQKLTCERLLPATQLDSRNQTKTTSLILGLTVVAWLAVGTSTVSAQATRTWVSGVGDDANPCSGTVVSTILRS